MMFWHVLASDFFPLKVDLLNKFASIFACEIGSLFKGCLFWPVILETQLYEVIDFEIILQYFGFTLQ